MHIECLGGVDMGLIGVLSLSWLEVEDGRVGRPVDPVDVSFGGRSRGNVWGDGVSSG